MTNILISHHLSIIADLEPSRGEEYRREAFACVDSGIATFEKVNEMQLISGDSVQCLSKVLEHLRFFLHL